MKRYISYILFTAGFMSQASLQGHAQSGQPINVVTTSVPFLRISPDARSGGMGDAGIATAPDVYASFWNTGKLPFAKTNNGVSASYSPWLRDAASDMFLAALSGYHKLNQDQAIHASFQYFSLGDIQFTDANGSKLNSFHPREFAIDAGYSRKLSSKAGLGISLKYIYSNLASDGTGNEEFRAGTSVAADLHYYYDARKADNGWSFGATLSNLGSKISYTENSTQKDFIPANLGLGAAYARVFNPQNRIQLALDVNKLLVPTPPADADPASLASYRNKGVVSSWFSSFGDAPGGFSEELKEFQISVGGEYWYNDQFAVRAGYFYENKNKGGRQYFTAGVGVKYSKFAFNFSYLAPSGSGANRSALSNTLRFGLALELD